MQKKLVRRSIVILSLVLLAAGLTVGAALAQAKTFPFDMVRSSAAEAAGCLANASGHVTVTEMGPVEVLDLSVTNLAPNTTYSFFVLQVPDKPFGIGWYNGEVETDYSGSGSQHFIARFNGETFAVAPGSAPAPVVHTATPFPDASSNPPFSPVHTFHLGLWFSDPGDANKAGCTNAVTPFDGDHIAGIQVLSTRNYPPDAGPLKQIAP
jgi:hypothetical protein